MEEVKNQKVNNKFTFAHGRRKEAVARIRLFKGKGEFTVNDKPLEEYFSLPAHKAQLQRVIGLAGAQGKYFASIKVTGSGKSSQLGAVIHSLARAFSAQEESLHSTFKKAHLLTRDPRVKERRKFGRAQKARKGKQSPKR